jgi:hypothetical protein
VFDGVREPFVGCGVDVAAVVRPVLVLVRGRVIDDTGDVADPASMNFTDLDSAA